jgi:hypothetical protein
MTILGISQTPCWVEFGVLIMLISVNLGILWDQVVVDQKERWQQPSKKIVKRRKEQSRCEDVDLLVH